MATNYLRRGTHSDFVEKFIAAKHLAREKKRSLKEERVKMRADKKKALEIESREVEEYLTRKCSYKSWRREEKKKRKEVKGLERQHLRDEEMRAEKEENRRLRIEELNSAQVFTEPSLEILYGIPTETVGNFFIIYSHMPLFQPIPVDHLVGGIHEKMQAKAPSNPVRKVGLFC